MQLEFIKNHWIGLGIGSIGWVIAFPYLIYTYSGDGMGLVEHLLMPEILFILAWIPGFMLAGYLYDRKIMSEKSLKKTGREWSTTFNSISDFVSVHDKDFKIVRVNKALTDFLGKKPEELIGKHCYEVFHCTSKPWSNCPHSKTLVSKKPVTEEVDDPGIGVPLLVTTSPIFDRDGEVVGSVHVAKDITESKQMEEALRESEEKHRTLIETAQDGICSVDLKGSFLFANERFCLMMGYPKDELLGKNWAEMLPEDKRQEAMEFFELALNEGLPLHIYEGQLKREDGSLFDVQVRWGCLCSDDKVLGGLGVVRDTTEHKRAEDEIRRLKTFNESVINGISDAISVIDTEDYRVVSANKAFLDNLGLRREDVLGRTCYEITHNRDSPCIPPSDPCPIVEMLKTGTPSMMEHVHLDKEKRKRFVEVTAYPIRDNGEIKKAVHITRDVTERKLAEGQIRKYAQELERSNKLKDLFTDIMRHDLLNPVTVIKGVSQILERSSPEEVKDGLAKIGSNASKLEVMIESAARLSKLDDEGGLRFQEEDLSAIFKEMVDNFKPMFAEKGIKVVYLPKGKCVAMVSSVVEDVFANLLSNAVKYSPPKSTVTIDILDDGNAWKVMVADQGEGVPEEYKEAIFNRFERGDKEGVKGTGLGLAIVKRVVELHKGKVWVEDNTPRGSIFYVLIPKNR
jgi:PAS domain S-box-containing protein